MTKVIVIAGALDTKGQDFSFVKELIQARGHQTLFIDFGVLEPPSVEPDIPQDEVARAGGSTIEELRTRKDKTQAMKVMATGLAAIVRKLSDEGKLAGILGMGGTGGTAIATTAMRELPFGLPKVMVSTIGGGDISSYVGAHDVVILPSIVDVAGLNRISRTIYASAAGCICGMVELKKPPREHERPLIAASMFGNTTQCIERARSILEERGYEVLVFHATGSGGRTMQSLVEQGCVSALFDITTTELADEVCGGVFSAGLERIEIGAKRRNAAVFAPGCVDMCNFWERSKVPERYRHRQLYEWNPNVTLMRTNSEENERIGRLLADTANRCLGPTAVVLPLKGVSMLDSPGAPFWDPQADQSCFEAIRHNLRRDISLVEIDANINEPEFADKATEVLLKLLEGEKGLGCD